MVHTMFKWSSYNFIFDNYRELKLIYKIQYMKKIIYKKYNEKLFRSISCQGYVWFVYSQCSVSLGSGLCQVWVRIILCLIVVEN